MFKYLACAFFGATLTALAAIVLVLPAMRDDVRAAGYHAGQSDARAEIAALIDHSLGTDLDPGERQEKLFDANTTSVVVVLRNGVKTIRTSDNPLDKTS